MCVQVHDARLHGLLCQLCLSSSAAAAEDFALPPVGTKEAKEAAEAAASRPSTLLAFEEGCAAAAKAFFDLGALPHAASLAEKYHDFKTLAMLCTAPPFAAADALMGGRVCPPPATLRRELLARYPPPGAPASGAAVNPKPLYASRSRSTSSLGEIVLITAGTLLIGTLTRLWRRVLSTLHSSRCETTVCNHYMSPPYVTTAMRPLPGVLRLWPNGVQGPATDLRGAPRAEGRAPLLPRAVRLEIATYL